MCVREEKVCGSSVSFLSNSEIPICDRAEVT